MLNFVLNFVDRGVSSMWHPVAHARRVPPPAAPRQAPLAAAPGRTRQSRFSVLIVTVLAAALLLPSGCRQSQQPAAAPPASAPEIHITVAAVGDLLIHNTVDLSVYDSETQTYDFAPVFAPVAPYLRLADYTVANLETRMAGPSFGYTSYPRFNTPAELATAMRESGISLMATANNHSLDLGWPGIVNTLDNLDAAGMPHIGTYRSPSEKAEPFIVDVHGIKLAWLNYTAVTNGQSLPPDRSFGLNVLDPAAVAAEAREARRLGADLVILVLHFGIEYQRFPNSNQIQIAQQLGAAGVDVIINSHPHVVQPIAVFPVQRDDGKQHNVTVAYSLGNFISDQQWRYSDSGIILYLEIVKDSTGTRVRQVSYLPVWVRKQVVNGALRFRVLPVLSAAPRPDITRVPGGGAADTDLSPAEQARMAQVWDELNTLLNDPAHGIFPYQASRQ